MDDAEFDARWTDSMQGISSPSVSGWAGGGEHRWLASLMGSRAD